MHHLSTIFSKNTLKDDEEIIVPALPYLQNMTRIIKETPKRYENRLCLCQDKSTKICKNWKLLRVNYKQLKLVHGSILVE